MPAASGQNRAAGVALDNGANHVNPLLRPAEIIQPEFEERFAGFRLPVGCFKELVWIGDAERDADPWEWGFQRHGDGRYKNTTGSLEQRPVTRASCLGQ